MGRGTSLRIRGWPGSQMIITHIFTLASSSIALRNLSQRMFHLLPFDKRYWWLHLFTRWKYDDNSYIYVPIISDFFSYFCLLPSAAFAPVRWIFLSMLFLLNHWCNFLVKSWVFLLYFNTTHVITGLFQENELYRLHIDFNERMFSFHLKGADASDRMQ